MRWSIAVLSLAVVAGGALRARAQDDPRGARWDRSQQTLKVAQTILGQRPPRHGLTSDGGRLWYAAQVDGAMHITILDPASGARTEASDGEVEALEREGSMRARVVRPGLFVHHPPVREIQSSEGEWFAGTREGELWIRSGASGEEQRIAPARAGGSRWDIDGAKWSPDDSKLALLSVDDRDVPTITSVRYGDRGEAIDRLPFSRVGDPIPRTELHVVDVATGAVSDIEIPGEGDRYLHIVGWSGDGGDVFVSRMSRPMDRLELYRADVRAGTLRRIISETSETFIDGLYWGYGYARWIDRLKRIVLIDGGERIVWTSERDGWRHLYLYDNEGQLVRPLTDGEWEVEQLREVDEAGGWVYYTCRPNKERPYDLALHRSRLEGSASQAVMDGPAIRAVTFAPDRSFFWAQRGGLGQADSLELRRADGTLIETIWEMDTSALENAGWEAPEEFIVKASDGETDLHGILVRPREFDAGESHPVIELIYAGPFTTHVPRSMGARRLWDARALADLGFVVVILDGRGTTGRGKAFQDVCFGNIGRFEIADHASALRQLAAERPWMDMTRVGIDGHSWGGYFTMRALLTAPDVYHAGIASSGAVDLPLFRVSIEPYVGCYPEDDPELFESGCNTKLAANLEGRLLLIHGTADDDVPYSDSMRMASALIAAGKPYEMVSMPGVAHIVQGPYWAEVVRRFFVEALGN